MVYLVFLVCFGFFGTQVFNQAGDDATGFVGLLLNRFKRSGLGRIVLTNRDVEVALDLGSRRDSNKQKLYKLVVRATSQSFRNICRDRASGCLGLTGQVPVAREIAIDGANSLAVRLSYALGTGGVRTVCRQMEQWLSFGQR